MGHIDLSSPCVPVSKGRYHRTRDDRFRHLGVENDMGNLQKAKISQCHLCPNCEYPKLCGNIDHIYVGTQKENCFDIAPEVRRQKGLNSAQFLPHSREQQSRAGTAGSKVLNSQVWECLVTGEQLSPGPLSCFQKKRGIDTKLRKRVK